MVSTSLSLHGILQWYPSGPRHHVKSIGSNLLLYLPWVSERCDPVSKPQLQSSSKWGWFSLPRLDMGGWTDCNFCWFLLTMSQVSTWMISIPEELLNYGSFATAMMVFMILLLWDVFCVVLLTPHGLHMLKPTRQWNFHCDAASAVSLIQLAIFSVPDYPIQPNPELILWLLVWQPGWPPKKKCTAVAWTVGNLANANPAANRTVKTVWLARTGW